MSPLPLKLPDDVERIVLLGGRCAYGAVCAASLALSPFLLPHQEIILANSITPAVAAAAAPQAANGLQEQLTQAAEDALAAATRELCRSRVEVGGDGVNPAYAEQSQQLPLQCFLGCQHPSSERDVRELLSRIRVHADEADGPCVVRAGTRDVVLCVLDADALDARRRGAPDAASVVRQLQSLARASSGATNDGGVCVVVVTDDRSRSALAPLLENCPATLVVARACELAPPALEYALTKVYMESYPQEPVGMLPAVATGVLLGVLTQLPVYRHTKVPFVPVDVAINAALCRTVAVLRSRRPPVSPAHCVFALDTDTAETMVWGMTAEYLTDYYGRYASQIRAAFPAPAVLPTAAPALHFLFSPSDVLNYGLETSDPLWCVDQYRSTAQRKRLQTTTPPSWRVASLLSIVDGAVALVKGDAASGRNDGAIPHSRLWGPVGAAYAAGVPQSLRAHIPSLSNVTTSGGGGSSSSSSSDGRNGGLSATSLWRWSGPASSATDSGSALLRRLQAPLPACRAAGDDYRQLRLELAADARSAPLLQYVSLADVDWGMYVRFVAKLALERVARHGAAGSLARGSAAHSSLPAPRFPFPTRNFVNEVVFAPHLRVPPSPSCYRTTMGVAEWIVRTGMGPNGTRGAMVPGLTPQRMAAILAQPHIQRAIAAAATDTTSKPHAGGASAVTKNDAQRRARKILLRIGDSLNQVHSRTLGMVVYGFLKRVYSSVRVSPGAMEKLHRLEGLPRTTLIYIPLHRSYTDFMIITYLFALAGLRVPHIVAGEDFLRLGKFAELMRGSGAFFMRRSFRGDPLYAALFKEYVSQLVRAGLPMEFFIEGTRSRTGKTMLPKLGLLKFITDAFLAPGQRDVDDVLFIPMSLSYDELLEAKIYAEELLGIPKPKESIPNMLRAASQLVPRYGHINLHVGEPISLRAARDNPLQCPVPFQPVQLPPGAGSSLSPPLAPTTAAASASSSSAPSGVSPSAVKSPSATPAYLLTTLGWRITYELQRNVVITAPSLLAAAIEAKLPECEAGIVARSSLTVQQLTATMAWLAHAVELRGGNLLSTLSTAQAAHGGNSEVDWVAVVSQAFTHLQRFVRVDRQTGVVNCLQPTITSLLGLHISTNQLIHVFVDEAVIAVIAHAFGDAIHADASSPSGAPSSSSNSAATTVSASPGATAVLGRSVKLQTLLPVARRLLRLLSSEFPNFSDASPCSYESWVEYALARLVLGEEERACVATCKELQIHRHNGNVTGGVGRHGQDVVVPSTQLYHFLLQMLLPHVEALYLVAVTSLACFEVAPEKPVLVRHLVLAAYKAAQRLYEQRQIDYLATCNRETVDHYFRSLALIGVLKTDVVVDLGAAYAIAGRGNDGAVGAAAQGRSGGGGVATGWWRGRTLSASTATVNQQEQRKRMLSPLESLVSELQALRWHPSADPREDVGAAKRTVLTCYHAVSRGAKL